MKISNAIKYIDQMKIARRRMDFNIGIIFWIGRVPLTSGSLPK